MWMVIYCLFEEKCMGGRDLVRHMKMDKFIERERKMCFYANRPRTAAATIVWTHCKWEKMTLIGNVITFFTFLGGMIICFDLLCNDL